MRLVGERPEHDLGRVDEVDLGAADVEVVVAPDHDVVDEVGQRPRRLDPGGARADDHEVERALVEQLRVPVGVLEHLEDAGAQPLGVVERVQRDGVVGGARGVEVVRLRPHGEDEVVAGVRAAVGAADGPGRRIDVGHLGHLHVDRLVLAEDAAERPGDIARRELRRGHLVEHRLERVVVVLVDQRDGHVGLGERLGAAHAGEAAAHHHHRRVTRFVGHRSEPRARVHDAAVGEDRRRRQVARPRPARNTTTLAISSGDANRPIGIASVVVFLAVGGSDHATDPFWSQSHLPLRRWARGGADLRAVTKLVHEVGGLVVVDHSAAAPYKVSSTSTKSTPMWLR